MLCFICFICFYINTFLIKNNQSDKDTAVIFLIVGSDLDRSMASERDENIERFIENLYSYTSEKLRPSLE